MNTRDILTMAGSVLLAVGEAFRAMAEPNSTPFWIGVSFLVAGPILMGARGVIRKPDDKEPPKP